MKKLATAGLLALSVMSLMACSNKKDEVTIDSNQKVEETTTKESNGKEKSTIKVENKGIIDEKSMKIDYDEVQIDDQEFQITSVEVLQPKEGVNQYSKKPILVVNYKYTNRSNDEESDKLVEQLTATQDKQDLEIAVRDSKEDETSSDKKIKSGETVNGSIAYELANEKDKVELQFKDGNAKDTIHVELKEK